MKKIFKDIWISKLTIVITIIQLIIPIFGGKKFFDISLCISILINILAMVLLNYNIRWLCDKDRNDEAEIYRRNAPCIFQSFKFAMGIIVSMVIVLINLIWKVDGINIEKIIIVWYLFPLLLIFVVSALMDSGLYDDIQFSKKILKLPYFTFIKNFLLCMFDYNKDGKLIITVKSVLNTIALIILVVVIIAYYLNIFL